MADLQTINGHGILRCEIAMYEVLPDEADVHGVDINDRENVRWMQCCFDLTERPPVDWGPWRYDDTVVSVTFADGSSNVLRMAPSIFDGMYCDWLAEQTQWTGIN